MRRIAPLLLTASLLIAAAPAMAAPGDLSFVEAEVDGAGAAQHLDAAGWLATSPDGRHVYVATAFSDQAITTFARNPATNQLGFVEADVDSVDADLGDMGDLVVSPDGRSLYSVISNEDELALFSRDPATGGITYLSSIADDSGGVDGLGNPVDVAVSPDARHVYVAGQIDNAVSIFSRDPATGGLAFFTLIQEGAGGVSGISSVRRVVVSPDGRHLYALSSGDQSVVTFERNPVNGALSQVGAVEQGVDGVDGLGAPDSLDISADGRSLYVTANDGSGSNTPSLTVFGRDPATGTLTHIRTQFRDSPGVSGINNATAVAAPPEGGQAYVAGNTGPAIPAFKGTLAMFDDLNPASRIEFAHAYIDDADGGPALGGIHDIEVTCDGLGAYAAATGDAAVSAFSREGGPGTCAPQLELSVPAKQKLRRRKATLTLTASCGREACALEASGKVKRAGKLKPASAAGEFESSEMLELKVPRKTLKRARKRLKAHRKTFAKVTVTGTDLAGNVATAAAPKIKLKR